MIYRVYFHGVWQTLLSSVKDRPPSERMSLISDWRKLRRKFRVSKTLLGSFSYKRNNQLNFSAYATLFTPGICLFPTGQSHSPLANEMTVIDRSVYSYYALNHTRFDMKINPGWILYVSSYKPAHLIMNLN